VEEDAPAGRRLRPALTPRRTAQPGLGPVRRSTGGDVAWAAVSGSSFWSRRAEEFGGLKALDDWGCSIIHGLAWTSLLAGSGSGEPLTRPGRFWVGPLGHAPGWPLSGGDLRWLVVKRFTSLGRGWIDTDLSAAGGSQAQVAGFGGFCRLAPKAGSPEGQLC